jgi:phosphohistidine phosphatase
MELLIVRHGPAGDAAEKKAWRESGRPDSERPLTKVGRERVRAAAKGLARFVDCGLVATSPYARAVQTAGPFAKALGADLIECPALVPGRPLDEAVSWLKSRREKSIALVGHDPHLSRLSSLLLTGDEHPIVRLKKPQALLLDLNSIEPGGAELIWSLPPRVLRAAAR